MPRLNCTYQTVIEILLDHGFVLHRHDGTSHRRYRGEHSGEVWFVDVAPHGGFKDNVPIKTLESMIRQSGLKKKLFRR